MVTKDSILICCEAVAKLVKKLQQRDLFNPVTEVYILPEITNVERTVSSLARVLDELSGKYTSIMVSTAQNQKNLYTLFEKYSVQIIKPKKFYITFLEEYESESKNISPHELLELSADYKQIIKDLLSHIEHIGDALVYSSEQRRMVQDDYHHQENLINKLNKINRIITSSLEINDLYQSFAKEIQEIIPYNRMSLATFDETGTKLKLFALAQEKKSYYNQGMVIPAADTAPAWIRRTGKYSIATDIKQAPVFSEDAVLAKEGFRSALRVPIISKGKIFGTLNLNTYESHQYSKKDAELLLRIVAQVSTALDNIRLFAETRQKTIEIAERNRRLAILNEIAQVINESLDLKSILGQTLSKINEFIGRSSGIIYLLEPETNELQVFVQKNIPPAIIKGLQTLQLNHNAVGKVVKTGIPLVINNIQEENYFKDSPCFYEVFKSVILTPIKARNKILGVVLNPDREIQQISEEDLSLLLAIGNQIGVAVENVRLYEQLKHLAEHDDLTGLQNRRMFYQSFRKELKRAVRYHKSLSILLIDVDNFKIYNDTYGHLAGDYALKKLSEAMKETVRETDMPTRYGGEEFAVVALESDQESAIEIAKRLQEKVKEKAKSCPLPTVSIGIASFPLNGHTVEQLVFNADLALYEAKRTGRNQIIIWNKN